MDQHIYLLKGKIQHYAWGGFDFIPQLLDIDNHDKKPYAEYWLDAHPNHSAAIENEGHEESLHEFIRQNPVRVLGETVAQKFNSLPYLFKVLDVQKMLSIQVHPSKRSAEEGFVKENAAWIPINAPHRNYKDENHKPELMVALGDFWLLHGFKPKNQLKRILSSVPEFNFLIDVFKNGNYKSLYEKVMMMEQEQVNKILQPLTSRILHLYKNGKLKKDQEHFWASRAVDTFCKNNNYDRGIFFIYFLNLIHLRKGEGIYQPAQLPHSYLEGQNIEVMANSDNVLRAGLTGKYIDVNEVLKQVKFEATEPKVLSVPKEEEIVFDVPADEFRLTEHNMPGDASKSFFSKSAEIVFVFSGQIFINREGEGIRLLKGESAFIIADTHFSIIAQEQSIWYKVQVPGV